MKEKNILYSSAALYLTFSQFKSIIPLLKDYRHVLLNVKDEFSWLIDDKYIRENKVLQFFDLYIPNTPFKEYPSNIKEFFKYKRLLFKYLYKVNPNAIISGSDLSASNRILSLWAKKHKIPFIIIQPSFINAFPMKVPALKRKIQHLIFNKILQIPLYQKQDDYGNDDVKSPLFLWGRYFVKYPKRKNTFILGNPALDSRFKELPVKRIKKNNILICTDNLLPQFVGIKYLEMVNETYKIAIKSKPNIQFYLKVHPRESVEKYEEIFPKNEFPNLIITRDSDLYELFDMSDIQISVASYTAFEAIVRGLPIITVRPDENLNVFDQFKGEIDIRVNDPNDIVNAIDKINSDEHWNIFLEKRKKYLGSRLYSLDGQSSKRVAETITKLTKNNSIWI